MKSSPGSLLSIAHLTVRSGQNSLLDDVTIALDPGETLGILGESGAGKSLLARCILQLQDNQLICSGDIFWHSEKIENQIEALRGRSIAYIPQSPLEASFPVTTIRQQWEDQCSAHGIAFDKAKVIALIRSTGIEEPERVLESLPHQLSGGQLQRLLVAMAMMARPSLIIADEPTTALDTVNQAAILRLLNEFCRKEKIALILITHDLSIIAPMCKRLLVLRQGKVVEMGKTSEVIQSPQNAYTLSLTKAHRRLGERLISSHSDIRGTDPILSVRNLHVTYEPQRFFWQKKCDVNALHSVSFDLHAGSVSGLAGISGAGKTTLMRVLGGVYPQYFDKVEYKGILLSEMDKRQWTTYRRAVQVIYQHPASALDPRQNARQVLNEALDLGSDETKIRINDLLDWVKLPAELLDRYPWQLSGGEKQRLVIARSLAVQPNVLLCDEPTSSLDQSIQAEILDLFLYLKKELNLCIMLVSHNLAALRHTCDYLTVMADGEVKEAGEIENVLGNPTTHYTQQLINADPALTHNFL